MTRDSPETRGFAPIAELVDRERVRLVRTTAARGGALACAGVALVLAVAIAGLGDARWLQVSPLLPFVVWLIVVAVVIGGSIVTVGWLRRGTTRASIARTIEGERSLRTGALRGALEVEGAGALGRRGAADLIARLGPRAAALAPVTQRRASRRALVGAALALAAVATCALLAGRTPDGWRAMLHPVRAWRGTLLPPLAIDAPADILRGERATVRVTAPGRRRIAVYSRLRGAEWSTRWYVVDNGATRLAVGPIDADLALVVADGRASSDTVMVRVSERPFVGGVALRAMYPAYLARADEALPAGEVARVPAGTRIAIEGRASTELAAVTLVKGADTNRLAVNGHRFTGRLAAMASGRWEWRAVGAEGPIADVPAALELDVVPDSAPRVEIVSPPRDTIVSPSERVALALAASDDHGLASVVVRSWRQPAGAASTSWSSSAVIAQEIVGTAPAQWSGDAIIDLSQRGLGQGDALHVVAVVTDQSPWHQTGMSRELILRVPSLTEERALARSTADSAAAGAAQVAQAQRALEQRTEDAARSRGQRAGAASPRSGASQQQSSAANSGQSPGAQPLSFASAEQAKALAQEQRQLADKVQALQEQAKQLEQQLKQAGALDTGLANQLHQAQQLLRDALTPELKAQLDKLQRSAQSLQGGDARQTLSDLAREQQKLREQLERSVEVLKRAALEGAMQTLHDEAKELARRDSAVAAQQHPPEGADPKALADRSRALSREVDSLSKRLAREKAETGAHQVAAAQPHIDAAAQAMDRAAGRQGSDSAKSQAQPDQQSGEPRSGQPPQPGDAQQSMGAQPQPGQQSAAQQPGAPRPAQQPGAQQPGAQQPGAQQPGAQQPGAQQPGAQQPGAQPAQRQGTQPGRQQQQPGGQPRPGQGGQPRAGQQGGPRQAASEAAQEMKQAAQQLADARQAQISEWKSTLTSELDRSIQETLQLARQEDALAKQAQQGAEPSSLKSQQSAVQQGVEQTSSRLQKAGRQSALVSGAAQRAVSEARSKVGQATNDVQTGAQPGQSALGQQAAGSMRDAADALNQAAAALVRDRERADAASSASGLAEMLEQMQSLAQQQGALNSQSQGLSLTPGNGNPGAEAQALAERQRRVAQSLDAMGGGDASGRTDALAKEAREIAAALARSGPDASTLSRQQRLYHRLLDAGHTLEQDERDSTGKRQAQSAVDRPAFTPGTAVDTKSASRYHEPTWNELRGLTPEERQLVIDYFKRINAPQ